MQVPIKLIRFIFMALILIFALIHLGVSIGIIVRFQDYGDIFRPERGLAAFNIVISVLGIIIGVSGVFAALYDLDALCKYIFLLL
jgi:succinate dehydrogenase hydrophobic anchor subunit